MAWSQIQRRIGKLRVLKGIELFRAVLHGGMLPRSPASNDFAQRNTPVILARGPRIKTCPDYRAPLPSNPKHSESFKRFII
jgi:hypothetical protein